MKNENLICPICGKPTSVWYGNARKDKLCREHAQQLKEGVIEQCPDCGKYRVRPAREDEQREFEAQISDKDKERGGSSL